MAQRESTDQHPQSRRLNKRAYSTPTLVLYGSITKLTQSGNGSGLDGSIMVGMTGME